MALDIRFNKYYPIAFLYFFLNGFLLPLGLLYTTLLTPIFLYWLLKFPSFKYVYVFVIVLLPYAIIHFINGVNFYYYLRSSLLLFAVYVFALAVFQFLEECKTLRTIYKAIILVNIVLVAFALLALASPFLRNIFWYANEITPGVKTLRLQLLTYEPSYYAVLFAPIALYYYLKMFILKLHNAAIIFFLVTIPILLSLSFGGIFGLVLSLLFTLIWGYNRFFDKRVTFYLLFLGVIAVIAIPVILIIFQDSVFVIRMTNVFTGHDTSFKGRTFDSFYLGWKIASQKSIWFGCGPGQVKDLSLAIFKKFYGRSNFTTAGLVIPNVLGDTLAAFGLVGLIGRFGIEIYFFFKTKVYENYYRLGLFLFIFIYQFTGSYITNIAEYLIWIFAFHQGIFEEFDKGNFYPRKKKHLQSQVLKKEN
ncbi:MAG: O-antigen ligase family protein [Bacteroidetes bacterium]|nr:O-antigen ligase family protein [Bacteroidota bacterium]